MSLQGAVELSDTTRYFRMILERVQLIVGPRIHIDNIFDLTHASLRHHACTKQYLILIRQVGGHGLNFTTIRAELVLWTTLQQMEREFRFTTFWSDGNSKLNIHRLLVLLLESGQDCFHQGHKCAALQKSIKR